MAAPGLFHELKRRNVLRAGAFYAAAVWALAQGISQLSPAFGMPDWVTRWFVIACTIGFPFWLTFAWLYEWTPEGIRRESEVAEDSPVRHSAARKLDFAIIGVLLIAVALLGSGYFIRRNSPVAQTIPFNPPAGSIVVLPFANLSDDPKQQYFSNGITEELTGALGRNAGFTVIAWETASKFAGSKETPAEIGKTLNVAHILNGSIQRDGNTVRVSAELVSAVDGRQLWSEHYDDSLRNIFAVQDKISAAIAEALKVKFAGTPAVPTLDPRAHDLYLKALAALDRNTATDAQAAQQYLEQALKLDPDYADAWAAMASSYIQLSEISTLPVKETLARVRTVAKKALTLDPQNANALVALGNADIEDNHIAQAKTEYEQALVRDPNNARAHMDYGLVLPLEQAMVQEQVAAQLDPDNATVQGNLAEIYLKQSDWSRLATAAQAMIRLSPHNIDGAFALAFARTQLQHGEDAVKAFDRVQPSTTVDRLLVDAGRLTYQALLNPALRPRAIAALDPLRKADISPNSQGDLLQLYLALGEKETAMQMLLSGYCSADPVLCNDLDINPRYAPLHGDPRFEKLSRQYATATVE